MSKPSLTLLQQLEKQVAALELRKQNLSNEVQLLENRLQLGIKDVTASIDIERATLTRQLEPLKSNIERLELKQEALKQDVTGLERDERKIKENIKQLKIKKQVQQSVYDEDATIYANNLANIQESIEKAGLELIALQDDKHQLAKDAKTYEAERSKAEKEYNDAVTKLTEIEKEVQHAKTEHDKLVLDNKNELNGILLKIQDGLKVLKSIQQEQRETAESIAEQRLALQKETEVLKRKEVKLSDSEQQVEKYARFMKL